MLNLQKAKPVHRPKSTRKFSKLVLGATIRMLAIALVLVGFAASATFAQTRAYVINRNDNTVSVIDPATNTVVATVPVEGPGAIAVTPDGAFAYLTTANHTVSVLDTATNTIVATVPVPLGSSMIAITPNGAFAYVTNLGIAVGAVSVIDTATNTVIATVTVGRAPEGIVITPDGAFAYVANSLARTVSVIDTATNTVSATIPGDSLFRVG